MNREKAVSLHSRYNPQAEAERYIASLSLNGNIRFFILAEPGLGYLIAPLRKSFPAAKILALHAEAAPGSAGVAPNEAGGGFRKSAECFAASPAKAQSHTPGKPEKPDAEWRPGSGISLQDFLEREIPDSEAAGIRLVEWRPARAVYGAAYISLIEGSAEFIKRTDANARTLKAFGRSWFKNFFRNMEIIRAVLKPVSLSTPVLVAGAGPGLEDAIPAIREEAGRGRLFILAVSSAAAALEAANIIPDMAISADGGAWAKFHLYETFRGKYAAGDKRTPLAAVMTAALPSQCGGLPILPISDGSFWQTLILKELKIPFMVLPQRGTVSAAALDLAFALTKGDIYIAGIDLANRDIRSHARPYSFDRFIEEKAHKLNPAYSQAYKRSSTLKAGGSYDIYASWFEKQLAAYPKRLHSLGKNNPLFASLETGSFKKSLAPEGAAVPAHLESFSLQGGASPEAARAVLEKALRDPGSGAALREELGPLLFRDGWRSQNETIEAVRALAGPGSSYG